VLPTSEEPLLNVEGLNDARTKLAGFFSILLDLLHVEQCQTGSQPCFWQDRAMHPKRGKLFDRFFPTDMESVGRAMLTELCRTDDERIASSPKSLADILDVFGQAGR
jgi:hypothetical protein